MEKLYIFGKHLSNKMRVDRRFVPNIDIVGLCRSNFVYVLTLVDVYEKNIHFFFFFYIFLSIILS